MNAGADQTICYTGTAALNGSMGGGATSVTWSSLGDGSFDDNTLLNATYTPGPNDIINGTATLVLSSDFQSPCTGASDQVVITVIHSVPSQPGPITGNTPACPGNTITYSISPVAGATTYSWNSIDGTTTIVSGQGTTSADILFGTLGAGQSTYPLSVNAVNQCGQGAQRTFSLRGKISQPSFTNSGPSVVCHNTSGVSYSISPVSGASSYAWSISGSGATINGPANGTSIIVDFTNFTSVTINVTASNACMTTPARTKTITSTPAIPGAIQGSSYVCPNGTYTFSVTPVAYAVSYIWNGPPGATVNGSSNSVSITFGQNIPAGATVSVKAVGSCNNQSAIRSKGVASGLPAVPSNITGPAYGQCNASGVSYSILPNNIPQATSYTWSVNNGASISGSANLSAVSIDFPVSFTTVALSVIANNSCGSSPARTLNVSGAPGMPASISGNAAPCAGDFETYCASATAGATSYVWTVPSGWTIVNTSPPCITVMTGNTGGNVTARASNACGISSARSKPVTISCRQSQVLNTESDMNVQLYPVPVHENAVLKFNSPSASNYRVDIFDMTGRKVSDTAGISSEGINVIELRLSQLVKGIYTVQVRNGENIQAIRMTVE